jgi:transposase
LAKFLKNRYPGAILNTCYEAGFSGFALHRVLNQEEINNIVVNAASIEVAANDRVKTDKRDSDKMRVQLSRGQLTSIHIPTLEEEDSRQLQRTRSQLVKHRVRTGNQIKSKLFQFGYIKYDDEREMSQKLLREIETTTSDNGFPPALGIAVRILVSLYGSITVQIKALEKSMMEQAAKQERLETTYRSYPGVGAISSRILATELGDMSRFHSQKSLYSFTGLTQKVRESQSGIRNGHLEPTPDAAHRPDKVYTALASDLGLLHMRIFVFFGG